MNCNNGSRVLAIGIDAAEPALIDKLITEDEMPALKSLLSQGRWLRVESPACIGSGSVWPTFITGEEPARHGVYGEWAWQPEIMGLRRYNGRRLAPFWKPLCEKGVRVGIMDVPFAPFTGFTNGFEVCEWGPHDLLEGRVQFSPETISDAINKIKPHPLSLDRLDTGGPHDYENLKTLGAGCLQGVKLRGALAKRLMAQTEVDLSIVVFTELHHSAHYMWHTIAGEHSIYQNAAAFKGLPSFSPTLKDIYLEVDRQIGKLVQAAGANATVMVFSLHGMRPSHGVPSFLEPLLSEFGYARFADWRTRSWTERAIRLLAAAKRHTPHPVKRLYYKTLPPATTLRIARPTMMAVYDWQNTRAFALPADQHGWIQVNLIGREVSGTVSPNDYDATCVELEQMLRSLVTRDGAPIVREVSRTASSATEAVSQRLPDLVVHWEDAAFSAPLKIKDSMIESFPVGRKFTGRHNLDGFCIFKGRDTLCEWETMQARDLHRVITRSLLGE